MDTGARFCTEAQDFGRKQDFVLCATYGLRDRLQWILTEASLCMDSQPNSGLMEVQMIGLPCLRDAALHRCLLDRLRRFCHMCGTLRVELLTGSSYNASQ